MDYDKAASAIFTEPEIADEPGEALFDSGRDYLDQITHYKRFQGRLREADE